MLKRFRTNRFNNSATNLPPAIRPIQKRGGLNSYRLAYSNLEARQLLAALAWEVTLSETGGVNFYGPDDIPNIMTLSIDPNGYTQHNLGPSGFSVGEDPARRSKRG